MNIFHTGADKYVRIVYQSRRLGIIKKVDSKGKTFDAEVVNRENELALMEFDFGEVGESDQQRIKLGNAFIYENILGDTTNGQRMNSWEVIFPTEGQHMIKLPWIKKEEGVKPEGAFLVYLEEAMMGTRIHAANLHKNISTVGSTFDHDAPKVLYYLPIEELQVPEEERAGRPVKYGVGID